MYLLDPDILSKLLKPVPSTSLISKMASVPTQQQFTSSITLGELVYGAHRQRLRTGALLEQLDRILLRNRRVLSFVTEAARRYGDLRAQLERPGMPLADAYLRIAAIALTHSLTMVTGNVRHFR